MEDDVRAGMTSNALFHCQHCGCETNLELSTLEAFAQDPYCHRCGLSVSEVEKKLQEELSTLVVQQMNLDSSIDFDSLADHATPAPSQFYITQHYHHSAHQADQPPTVSATASNGERTSNEADDCHLVHPNTNIDTGATDEQAPSQDKHFIASPDAWSTGLSHHRGNAGGSTWREVSRVEIAAESRTEAEPYILWGYDRSSGNNGPPNSDFTAKSSQITHQSDPVYQVGQSWSTESRVPSQHVSILQPAEPI